MRIKIRINVGKKYAIDHANPSRVLETTMWVQPPLLSRSDLKAIMELRALEESAGEGKYEAFGKFERISVTHHLT